MSRRGFLRTASLSGATLLASNWISARGAATAEPRPPVLVGAHPWVYAATQPNYDITARLPEIFADMQYAGIAEIELMHTALRPTDAVSRIGALSRRHEVPVVGASIDEPMWDRRQHARILAEANVTIPRLAALGGRTLGTSVGPIQWGRKIRKTEQQLDDQAALLRQLDELCATHGVVMNLHNHTYEVENDEHDLRGTLSRIPDAKLGPDLNWLIRAGVDPVAFIRRYRGRIVFLHLRDQASDGRWSEALGEGTTDFAAIANVLREVDFRGDAMIELAHESDFTVTRPLRESLKRSRDFVRTTFGY